MKKELSRITNPNSQELQVVILYKNIFYQTDGGQFSSLDKKLLDIKRISSILEEIKEKLV